MTDITERLRGTWAWSHGRPVNPDGPEGADEIELLRHSLGLCQTQLFKALYYHGYPDHGPLSEPATIVAIDSAKYALEGK